MWSDWVLPRLEARGLGRPIASVTLRLTGIGESAIADRLGDMLTAARPQVATYARADAVDIRIWALEEAGDGAAAEALVAATEARIVELLGEHIWARGTTTWPEALRAALEARAWRLSTIEIGLRGALAHLLGEGLGDRLAFTESLLARPAPHDGHKASLEDLAERARELGGCEVGVATEARERGGDTAVTVAIATPAGTHRETRVVFLAGPLGRGRAAIATAAIVLRHVREGVPG